MSIREAPYLMKMDDGHTHDWRESRDCDGNLKPYLICSKCDAGLVRPQPIQQEMR